MQVFGVCKSYNYITHLSTYTPTRSRANHRLVFVCTHYSYQNPVETVFSLWLATFCECQGVHPLNASVPVLGGFGTSGSQGFKYLQIKINNADNAISLANLLEWRPANLTTQSSSLHFNAIHQLHAAREALFTSPNQTGISFWPNWDETSISIPSMMALPQPGAQRRHQIGK